MSDNNGADDGALTEEQFQAELAAIHAERARLALGTKIDQQQAEADRQAARTDVLTRWVAAGLEQYVLPNSAEEFAQLPMHARLLLEQKDESLARMLAPAVPLSAGLELRLSKGIDFLQPDDVEPLIAAGHASIVEQLRQRHQQQVWAAHEESNVAMAQQQEAMQAHWEEQRLAGLERHNATMRAEYAARLMSGRG